MKISELFEDRSNITYLYKNHVRTLESYGNYFKEKTIEIIMYLNQIKIGYIEVAPRLKSIEILSIDPEYQNKGYATILMKKVLAEFDIKNLSVVKSGSGLSRDQLVDFYKKFGFKVVKNAKRGDPVMKINEDIVHEDGLMYELSVTDYYKGETFGFIVLYDEVAKKKIGYLDWSKYEDEVWVKMIEIYPEYRRKGYGTKIINFLKKSFPNKAITYSGTTPDGDKFLKGINKDLSEETHNLPSINYVKKLSPEIVSAAQYVYDRWDEDNTDDYAEGGICHLIADKICDVLAKHKIEAFTVSSNFEQHVYTIVKVQEGVYTVDIHPSYYETGGGYNWKKIPNVIFTPDMIEFYRITNDPSEFDNFSEG